MEFFIKKSILGTPFNLYCKQNGEIVKTEQAPPNVLDIQSKEAWLYSKVYGFNMPFFPPRKYYNSYKEFNIQENVPWHYVMPIETYKIELKKYVDQLKQIFFNLDTSYYDNFYKEQNILFESLKPAKINVDLFLKHLNNNFGEHDSIKTFVPNNGYTEKPYYDRFATITGRLTMYKGPHILNLKKEYRNILESRFGDKGKVYYFDYSSLEPRVLLTLTGKQDIPADIYTHVSKELNLNIDRKVIKQVVLTKLYGGTDETIDKQLKHSIGNSEDIINLIMKYFNFEEFKNNIIESYYKNNGLKIENYFKRPILCENTPPYKLLNYYIQSTAVDVALLGFTNIIKRIKMASLEKYIIPIFLLHDAIFIDVHNDYKHLVEKLCKAGSINIPNFETINFYLKTEENWFI